MTRGARPRTVLGLASLIWSVSGCGGVVATDGRDGLPDGGEGGAGSGAGLPPLAPLRDGGAYDPLGPACDGAGIAGQDLACDPLDPIATCPPGLGCHLYGSYTDDPCDRLQVQALCDAPGPGLEGDACTNAQDCAAGFACTVRGQCRRICRPGPGNGCPDGLICEAGSYFYGFCR